MQTNRQQFAPAWIRFPVKALDVIRGDEFSKSVSSYDDGTAIVFRPETALARTGTPGSTQASAAMPDGRDKRGREITNVNPRDPRITKRNTRSELL